MIRNNAKLLGIVCLFGLFIQGCTHDNLMLNLLCLGVNGSTCSEDSIIESGFIKCDEKIDFGHYEQDNDMSNGKEPITWCVLDKNSSGQYLIVSEKVIDVQRYNMTAGYFVNWEESTIRSWLNGYDTSHNKAGMDYTNENFIDAAFSTEEKSKIIASNVPADENPKFDTSPGDATTDKIFLLSIAEAIKYSTGDKTHKPDATRYANQRGVGPDNCTDVHCYADWWLRSSGYDWLDATFVTDYGINCYGVYVDSSNIGVRPALWVQY